MGHKTERHQGAAESTVKDIRRKTRKRYSSEEKIRIVIGRETPKMMLGHYQQTKNMLVSCSARALGFY